MQIVTLRGFAPDALGQVHELVLLRAGHGAGACEGLSFPELGARFVVGLVSRKRTGETSFLAVRSQSRIQSSDAPFRSWLRHRDYQILRRADIVPDKKHI